MDIRHPDHPRHAQAVRIRTGISFALQHNNHLLEFRREDVPPITTCATAHATMTALLRERDHEEHAISVILSNITVDTPTPQIEARYTTRTKRVYEINRALFHAYVEFLTPLGTRPDYDSAPTTTSHGTSNARDVSAGIRQRVYEQRAAATHLQL
jgi:hypothetical protein